MPEASKSKQKCEGSSDPRNDTNTGSDEESDDGSVVDISPHFVDTRGLFPSVQILSIRDLEACLSIENSVFSEKDRCSEEKVHTSMGSRKCVTQHAVPLCGSFPYLLSLLFSGNTCVFTASGFVGHIPILC